MRRENATNAATPPRRAAVLRHTGVPRRAAVPHYTAVPRYATPSRLSRILWGALLMLQLALALGAPLIAPHDPYEHRPEQRFRLPSREFWLGTDHLGRDILSRIIFGGRELLFTLAIALTIAWLIGGGVGLFTVVLPLPADSAITLLLDIALSFPTVLLSITLISVFGASLWALAAALGLVFAPVVARQVRAVGKAIFARPYIQTVRTAGGGNVYILFRHILPAMASHILRFSAIVAVAMIAIASALSFLGLARRPPVPDWGLLLRDARNYIARAPWMALFAGLAIVLTGLSLYAFGESMRESEDRWRGAL